ncbi:hypothetical protein QQF64_017828 [Cirrhinus molitorella]|uniref:Uncharacterized protein n=1 Tax=Cirrhinus molitorella TaxID=172907 RepID=A0ABR3LLC6_9TELE
MDGSPCNIKSAVSGNASGATPFIAPAPSTTRPLALLSRRLLPPLGQVNAKNPHRLPLGNPCQNLLRILN